MEYILNTLFIKRFCLPFDADISSYENGMSKITSCLCGNYNHACCILQGNINIKKATIISFGFNKMGDIYGNEAGIHAEYDAIQNLKPLGNRKKLEPINMVLIRFSTNYKLQNSKPCSMCVRNMKILPGKKGYIIKNIYYSDENGVIIKSNLNILKNSEQHYSRFYRRKMNKVY